jgi:cell division protein FtsW
MGKHTRFIFSNSLSLFLTTLLLCALGLLFVFDASVAEAYATFQNQYHFLQQHAFWLGAGMIALCVGYVTPLSLWKKLSPILFIGGLALLIMVFVPGIGRTLNGASRWIYFGNTGFQPVELMKFALVVFFASWLTKHQRLLPFLLTTGIPAILIILQPDLGSLLVISSVAVGLYFIAGGKVSHLLGVGVIGITLLALAVITSPYRMQRVTTFFNPEADPLGAGFHVRQITLALGRGGLFGQGIGNSRQKFSYIPEASTDSIFAIIAEEVGFVGSTILIALFGWFFSIVLRIITKPPDHSFEQLLGWGIFFWLAAQTMLNLAAVVALVPLTGIPLPFFSYGGTSLVMLLFITGILLRISKQYNEAT